MINIEEFFKKSCNYLGITLEDNFGIYKMIIPEEYKDNFNDLEYYVSFTDNDNAIIINEDSFLLKQLSLLINSKISAYSKATQYIRFDYDKINEVYPNCYLTPVDSDKEYFLFVTLKITIFGHMVTEHLTSMVYDFQKDSIKHLKNNDFYKLKNLATNNNFVLENETEKIQEAIDYIYFDISDKVIQLVREKQEKYDSLITEEINRIEEYYSNILSKMDKATNEEVELIIQEKENLLSHLEEKYNINLNDVEIEDITCLLIEQDIAKAEMLFNEELFLIKAK